MPDALATPEVLQWARGTAHLTVDEVARRMNLSPDTVRAWEEGSAVPTYAQLERLAYEVYRRPLPVFYFPEPPIERLARHQFRTLPETEFMTLPPKAIYIIRKATTMQMYARLFSEGSNPPGEAFISELVSLRGSTMEEAAARVRNLLGVSLDTQVRWRNTNTALREWRKAMERKGICVFREPLETDEISGFCLFDSQFPVIYLNSSMPKSRQIFTIFHELAHIMWETSGVDKIDDSYIRRLERSERRIEIFCNYLAGRVLVPDRDFDARSSGQEISDLLIQDLARTYSVSREVILRKLLERRLVTREEYEQKAEIWTEEARVAGRSREGGPNFYRIRISYLGDRYLSLAFGAYYAQRIDSVGLARSLGVKVSQLGRLEAEWRGAR
jgi:Zn-dependent peptidase ImmA (M78 family)/transcriptional regulator with XRE-family HTH domain